MWVNGDRVLGWSIPSGLAHDELIGLRGLAWLLHVLIMNMGVGRDGVALFLGHTSTHLPGRLSKSCHAPKTSLLLAS